MVNKSVGILQDIDRCVRCRGCQVACERRSKMAPFGYDTSGTWNYGTADGATCASADDLVAVRAQKDVDMGPYVRYGCWHCAAPPCVTACQRTGKNAIEKLDSSHKANGAVVVDYTKCEPGNCEDSTTGLRQPCTSACRKGAYPKIGDGTSEWHLGVEKMYKCDMCWDRIDEGKLPMCVETCPAKAYMFGTGDEILARLNSPDDAGQRFSYVSGNDNFIWATRNTAFLSPKSDPFVEDHISPMIDKLVSGPFGKTMLVPVGVVGGLYALYRRRVMIAEEQELLREGV